MSCHRARATGSEMRTFRKSAGMLCTAPGEIAFLIMDFILYRMFVFIRIGLTETKFWRGLLRTSGLTD